MQLFPAKQEELLAYELGAKLGLFDRRLQLNAAGFYYDYTDKQILGAINDFVFGSLPALVNVPDSHVIGYEVDAVWEPIDGLRIAPSISYAKSEVDGHFRNFDPFFNTAANGSTKDFSGEPFPNAPKWTSNVDVQYTWSVRRRERVRRRAYELPERHDRVLLRPLQRGRPDRPGVGIAGHVHENLSRVHPVRIRQLGSEDQSREHCSMCARASNRGRGRCGLGASNITDKYYWNQAQHVNDVLLRYAGMPETYGVTVSYRTGG